MKLLQADLMNYDTGDRLEKCHSIASLLDTAHAHGDFALRGKEGCREEKLFVQFLALLQDSAISLQVMTKHEHLLMSDRELLREFLAANPESIDRSAAEHHQLAFGLLKETIQLIQMASETFQKVKKRNVQELETDEARGRYQRAYDSFQKQTPG